MNDNQIYQAALSYAAQGWRVLPLHGPEMSGKGKRPLLKKWPSLATTDPALIKRWWEQWPEANVGILTGGGLVVVDVDGQTGRESLSALEGRLGKLPKTRMALTGGGGFHLYFRCDRPLPTRAGLEPGIDIRGEGGCVVAPPSVHVSGEVYRWA